MKRLFVFFAVVFLLVVVFRGPSPSEAPTVGQPQVVSIVLDPSLQQYEPAWKAEVGRRFSNAVIVMVHGDDMAGMWFASPPWGQMLIEDVVDMAAKLYPDRTIVVLSCNTGHFTLHRKGVYYAKSSIWLVPDRAITVDDAQAAREGRRTLNDALVPTTIPATQPTTKPSPLSIIPFNFPSFPMFPKRDVTMRWQDDPDAVGNVYEFVVEK